MANILVIDSSTDKLLVALVTDNGEYTKQSYDKCKKHNGILLPYCEAVIVEAGLTLADISAVACNCGPGSFTGIRLGVTTANGLAATGRIKLISMNTLEIIAYNEKDNTIALLDSKHGNFYGGIKTHNDVELSNYTIAEVLESSNEVIILSNCEEHTLSKLQAGLEGRIRVMNYAEYLSKVCRLAMDKWSAVNITSYLQPVYLKESQAERELAAKVKNND